VEHLFRVIANPKTNVTRSRNGLPGSQSGKPESQRNVRQLTERRFADTAPLLERLGEACFQLSDLRGGLELWNGIQFLERGRERVG
jgi:hypothetical protein